VLLKISKALRFDYMGAIGFGLYLGLRFIIDWWQSFLRVAPKLSLSLCWFFNVQTCSRLMKIPKIGDTIDNNLAIELCEHCQFDDIAALIEAKPEHNREWEFDGAAMLTDRVLATLVGIDLEKFIQAPLKHDLKYAYGIPGDKTARQLADKELEQDFLGIDLHCILAKGMFFAVDLFGGEEWATDFFGRSLKRVLSPKALVA
jgi:hypothetical protein